MDGRGLFGAGRYRAMLAFVGAPWLGLAGIAIAIPSAAAGATGPAVGGLLLLGVSVVLLAWSFVMLWRSRGRCGA